VEYSSYNRITEKPAPSIGKGTDVNGVGSSEPTRQRVRRGDEPLQTPLTSVPAFHDPLYVSPKRFIPGTKAHRLLPPPLGAESSEPASPVASGAPAGSGAHSDRREASPSPEGARHYAQIRAISSTTSEEEKQKREKNHRKNLESACPSVYLHGKCEEGHEFAKGVICNREWCEEEEGRCGGKHGLAHQRRVGRWLSKARQIGPMGRFVFSLPPEVRGKCRTPKTLGKLGTANRRLMQRHGFDRGLRRWHLFGEDHRDHDVDAGVPKYHPHLEVLVDGGGYLSRKQLGAIKRSWANILHVPISRINVYYEYIRADDIRKKLHRVSYALRPTFTDWRWDVSLAYSMIGFHNAQPWGTWDGPDLWEIPEGDPEYLGSALEALGESRCPIDHTPITWDGFMSGSDLQGPCWEEVGGGYWQKARPPPT